MRNATRNQEGIRKRADALHASSATQPGLTAFTLLAAATGSAVHANAEVTGEDWKPYVPGLHPRRLDLARLGRRRTRRPRLKGTGGGRKVPAFAGEDLMRYRCAILGGDMGRAAFTDE